MKGITETLITIVKNTAPILFETISALVGYNPTWSVLFLTSVGLINVWGEFGQKRINELVEFIAAHKEEFLNEVLESDKFKAVFLNVLEMHMKEVNDQKRALLRNYLLAVGKNTAPDFSEHTKLIYTLNTITLEELDFLALFGPGGPISQFESEHKEFSLSYYDLSSISHALNMTGHRDIATKISDGRISDKYNQIMVSLGHKDLLWVATSDGFGSRLESKVRCITEFGKVFLLFITNADTHP